MWKNITIFCLVAACVAAFIFETQPAEAVELKDPEITYSQEAVDELLRQNSEDLVKAFVERCAKEGVLQATSVDNNYWVEQWMIECKVVAHREFQAPEGKRM